MAMTKKRNSKKIIFAGCIVAFAVVEYLNFTGFCYSERRYIPIEQIKYRRMWAWGDVQPIPSDEEMKKQALLHNDPRCCHVSKFDPWDELRVDQSTSNTLLNRFFGRYLYKVDVLYPKYARNYPSSDKNPPIWESYRVDACGKGQTDGMRERISQEEYEKRLKNRE